MEKKLLSLNRVCFSYNHRDYPVENVSFDVREGEVIGIAGPNGAGKTTLLKLIVGILKPSKGSIKIRVGKTKTGKEWRIGYLPQDVKGVGRDFPATVREVVGTGLYSKLGIFRQPNDLDRTKIDSAIRNVGLRGFRNTRISSLSGGQLQRVLIARAMVSDPSLLIMDEPTAAVDLAGEEKFYRLVKHINSVYGVAVILVSHDVYSLLSHTNRLLFINRRVLYDGEPQELGSTRLLNLLFSHKHSKALVKELEGAMKKRR